MSTFSILPGTLIRHLLRPDTDGAVGTIQAIPATGSPPPVHLDPAVVNAWALFTFTPPDTSAEMSWSDVPSVAGANEIDFRGGSIANFRHILMWARRKRGTSGAIVANTAILKGSNGVDYVEIGRITIGAAAAATYTQPLSDILSIIRQGTNEAWLNNISSADLHIDLTAADTDLEICVLALGITGS